ncbi:hypothetical protein J2X01_002442 [Arthrobacter ginsengisoli]|uniref:Protein NO VEIN C-terminal domain-containing protein n=1 Tax=Arthrobacter ginsengisoli TaxID=1356565 RepID=A0ABU1UD84_9MICC|nr:DUF3883 domain-containing protein [Arthrobacter ginsengisoli]MDR7083149.1 hypothetical protein [Arthrobacter ginsengisoli]
MVINIRLSDRTTATSDDPLGRDWYGYDPGATPEQLWANNRGDWFLDKKRIASERWAALNYLGEIVLVAELNDPAHEIVTGTDTGRPKKALIGRVLADGHSIHQVLMGTQVEYPPGSRNSILYRPDPETAVAANAGPAEARDLAGAGGQGLQMDADVRRAIENAAQDRLMRHYRDRGWTVTDTRQNRPYDAVAVRDTERIYLEAKGTQSKGDSVIVTRNEVGHARQHPGLCMMGVWSGMRLVDGEVDPRAGDFRIIDFDPEDRQLRPRDFDWRWVDP